MSWKLIQAVIGAIIGNITMGLIIIGSFTAVIASLFWFITNVSIPILKWAVLG